MDQDLDYLRGNIVKYVCRAKLKGHEKEDLLKARAYIDKALEVLEDREPET